MNTEISYEYCFTNSLSLHEHVFLLLGIYCASLVHRLLCLGRVACGVMVRT